jgi:hypothetical protein
MGTMIIATIPPPTGFARSLARSGSQMLSSDGTAAILLILIGNRASHMRGIGGQGLAAAAARSRAFLSVSNRSTFSTSSYSAPWILDGLAALGSLNRWRSFLHRRWQRLLFTLRRINVGTRDEDHALRIDRRGCLAVPAPASRKTRKPGYSFLDCRTSFLKPRQTLQCWRGNGKPGAASRSSWNGPRTSLLGPFLF